MSPCYLTTDEVAERLLLRPRTVRRRIEAGVLPTLRLTPKLLRVEAAAVDPEAPVVLPETPPLISTAWLAHFFRIHPRWAQRFAQKGIIPMHKRGGDWVMSRRELWGFLADHTTGDEAEREPYRCLSEDHHGV